MKRANVWKGRTNVSWGLYAKEVWVDAPGVGAYVCSTSCAGQAWAKGLYARGAGTKAAARGLCTVCERPRDVRHEAPVLFLITRNGGGLYVRVAHNAVQQAATRMHACRCGYCCTSHKRTAASFKAMLCTRPTDPCALRNPVRRHLSIWPPTCRRTLLFTHLTHIVNPPVTLPAGISPRATW